MLAEKTPARFVAFDLLAEDDEVLLEAAPARAARGGSRGAIDAPVDLTPTTADPGEAAPWLQHAEGVIAKRAEARYCPGERVGMVKIKRVRTMDAVVMGWRPGKEEGTVGSLILGLYDDDGRLREVGHTSGFRAAEKRALPAKLEAYETGRRGTGEPSRWAGERELEWIELRPELVVEVTLRPHEQQPHAARREDRALARGQAAAGVPHRPARPVAARAAHARVGRFRPWPGAFAVGYRSWEPCVRRRTRGAAPWPPCSAAMPPVRSRRAPSPTGWTAR